MINFTQIQSHKFWEDNVPELSKFFKELENFEYWTTNEEDIFPFLIFFEIRLNKFNKLGNIFSNHKQFASLIEILSYLKLGTFFFWIYQINKEQPSFITSALISCKQENTVFEKLFIERFQLLERYNLLPTIFNEAKIKLIRTIISD